MYHSIINSLINWFIKNKRDLPWRHTSNPYKIWVSEIILQQTRVEQGLSYYNRFVDKYPDVRSLAGAKDDQVMKLWQGLGYYSRARNLLAAARTIEKEHKGKFPQSYDEIKKLKGIGDYTAAAIASFAFNLKNPVLDGNVYRFITRLFGIETPIDKAETKKTVMAILTEMIEGVKDPATFNQALMEFGALQCTPSPKCETCPFNRVCYAFKENKTSSIPVKGKAIKVKDRYLNYFVFLTGDKRIYIKKRTGKDIWQNLYDFPLIETPTPISLKMILKKAAFKEWTKGSEIMKTGVSKPVLHKLSHQNLYVTFYVVDISGSLHLKNSPIFDIEINTINSFAVPRVIEKFVHSIIFKPN